MTSWYNKSQRRVKKNSLTLIEVVIGCVLLAVLLSTLFTFYRNLLFAKSKATHKKELVLSHNLLRETLYPIFTSIPYPSLTQGSGVLYTDAWEESKAATLFFQSERKIDPDPNFCDLLDGAIYLDSNHDLQLILWSSKAEPKTILLFENCLGLEWEFLHPNSFDWVSTWPKDEKELPIAIKIKLQEKNNSVLEYSFPIPKAQKPVQYQKAGS